MCRRQRVVAGFAAQRAVLRWCRFKILSLWRRHIWPVFALLEAWRALSGCSCGSSGRRRGWSQVAMGRARSIGQGRPGVPVPKGCGWLCRSACSLRWCGFKILTLRHRHTRPSFAVFAESGGGLGAGCGRLRRVALAAMGRARRGIPSETVASFGDTPSGPAALGTGVSF
jgi:hypothetical protein